MNFFDHVDVWKAKVDPQGTDTIFFVWSLLLFIIHKFEIAISESMIWAGFQKVKGQNDYDKPFWSTSALTGTMF